MDIFPLTERPVYCFREVVMFELSSKALHFRRKEWSKESDKDRKSAGCV